MESQSRGGKIFWRIASATLIAVGYLFARTLMGENTSPANPTPTEFYRFAQSNSPMKYGVFSIQNGNIIAHPSNVTSEELTQKDVKNLFEHNFLSNNFSDFNVGIFLFDSWQDALKMSEVWPQIAKITNNISELNDETFAISKGIWLTPTGQTDPQIKVIIFINEGLLSKDCNASHIADYVLDVFQPKFSSEYETSLHKCNE